MNGSQLPLSSEDSESDEAAIFNTIKRLPKEASPPQPESSESSPKVNGTSGPEEKEVSEEKNDLSKAVNGCHEEYSNVKKTLSNGEYVEEAAS